MERRFLSAYGDSGCVSRGLSLFTCSGSGGQREGGISGGEVTKPGEFPMRHDESGVLVEQLADVFGGLALAVSAAFVPDGAQGGGVAADLRSEGSPTPRHRE